MSISVGYPILFGTLKHQEIYALLLVCCVSCWIFLFLLQVLGAAAMVSKTGKHPGQLKDDVASPGGTTIAGIHELEKGGFRGTLMNAVAAAAKRSRELSQS